MCQNHNYQSITVQDSTEALKKADINAVENSYRQCSMNSQDFKDEFPRIHSKSKITHFTSQIPIRKSKRNRIPDYYIYNEYFPMDKVLTNRQKNHYLRFKSGGD